MGTKPKVRVVRSRKSVSANYQLWICLMVAVIIVQTVHLSLVETLNSIRGEYFVEYGKLPGSIAAQQRANVSIPSLEKMFQIHEGKCRVMTSPWGLGFEPKTASNMNDWTFKSSRHCEPFSIDLASKVRIKVSLNCDQSPPSILTSKTDKSRDVFTVGFGNKCLGDFIESCCIDENPVPNVVHFVWFNDAEMGFFNFISLLSAIRFMKPCLILLHGPFLPRGAYWDYLVQLSPNIVHVRRERPLEVFGNQLKFKEHSSDVMRIEALMEYGGIYMDFDEVLLRPLDSLRRFEYVQGHELPHTMGSQVVISKKNATFLQHWYASYRDNYRKIWAHNALWVPNTIAKNHPELIHVEGFNFTRPNWKNVNQIYEKNYDWRTNYGMHMYARWYKQPVDLNVIRTLNTTVGAVSRHIIFGNKELCIR